MWVEACRTLERSERLRRQFFGRGGAPAQPVWEPPVDVLDLGDRILVVVALPGVEAKTLEVSFEGGVLSVFGHRPFPEALRRAEIRVVEIPWGRFGRRIALASPRLSPESCELANGCLNIVLVKR